MELNEAIENFMMALAELHAEMKIYISNYPGVLTSCFMVLEWCHD
jgi:hypothetical protein